MHRSSLGSCDGGKASPAKRILLADDDPAVRNALKNLLDEEGYTVLTAENGQQALDLVAQSALDLVILDVNMPVKGGWDTFERVTTGHPLLPVIIITGRPGQLFTAASAGVSALLEKPFEITTLLRTISSVLAESVDVRLARMTGHHTAFHYSPSGGK
jgi:CheY-like chemotaxis protein